MDERRRDGRIHPARQRADDVPVAAGLARARIHARADLRNGRLDEVRRRPFGFCAGEANDEVAQDVAAARRVHDLGVELDPVQAAVLVDKAGELV